MLNIMDIYDKQALELKRLPSDPIAYADMEETYNKEHSPEFKAPRMKKSKADPFSEKPV
jgi:hypothetical protein